MIELTLFTIIVLALLFGGEWLASIMGRQEDQKRYMVDEEANLAELDGFARVRDGADEVRNG